MISSSPRVAVVVLNWNGIDLLREFLPSWVKSTSQSICELIIVDNGSTDSSVSYMKQCYPGVRLICFSENYGFADGYNRAIAQLEHEVVVLLNSDATPYGDRWLEQPLTLLDAHPDIVAIQPKILAYRSLQQFEYAGAAGGFIDYWGYPYCRGRIFSTIETDQGQYDDVSDIFWASGACLIIRREAYISVGGLDARFFAHQEEIDLCWRLWARGGRVVYAPLSVVYHVGGASLEQGSPRKCYLNFRNNLLMLYKNLPEAELRRVMCWRWWLDYLSAVQFLITGRWGMARAVYRARRDFTRMRSAFLQSRKDNLCKTVVDNIPTMASWSVLLQYYIRRRKVYSDLPDL